MATSTSTEFPISDTTVRTTIQNSGGITSADTQFDVGIVKNEPSVPFLIGVWRNQSPLREDDMEFMEVTNISDNESGSRVRLTVTRGQKDTTPISFSDGDYVFMAVSSADVFDQIIREEAKSQTVSIVDEDAAEGDPTEQNFETVEPFFNQSKFTVLFQSTADASADVGAHKVGAVLLLDAANGDSTVVTESERTNVVQGPLDGTTGEDGFFTVGVRSDGKVDLENRTGSQITVSVSSRK